MDYQDKLKLAKEALDSGSYDKKTIEYIFPELKESEDEKIRRGLIAKLSQDKELHHKEIAWLEKQGEKTNPYSGVSFKYNGHIWGMCARDNGVDILLDKQLFKHLENQSEQKPTDKVEPKFKVGDWVRAISSGNIFKILSVSDGLYRVLCYDGVEANYPIKDVEKDLAYWTLKDAKDGDVLVVNGRPFLFKGLTDKFYPERPVAYCGIDTSNMFFVPTVENCWTVNPCLPAAKEQRDLLFQKMKEAGYEWDDEKKELKEIKEQNPTEDTCKISDCDKVDMTEYNNGYECGKQRVLKYPEDYGLCKKSTWSEEDEVMILGLINCIDELQEVNGWNYTYVNSKDVKLCDIRNWLKSIKERME